MRDAATRQADHGLASTLAAFEASPQALGRDVLDLYLIHRPSPPGTGRRDRRAFGRSLADASVRAIDVSKKLPAQHLDRVVTDTGVTPVVNQIEVPPTFSQAGTRAVGAARGIAVAASSPLGRGGDVTVAPVLAIAQHPGRHARAGDPGPAPARGPDRDLQVDAPPSDANENLAATEVTLSSADLASIDELDYLTGRVGGDPATFEHPRRTLPHGSSEPDRSAFR